MNMIKLKGLRIFKDRRIIFRILSGLTIIIIILAVKINSKFEKTRFYYVNYSGDLEYDFQYLPRKYKKDFLIEFYFSGGRNRRKFPVFFLDSQYISGYHYDDDTFYLSLNKEGYEVFKQIDQSTLKKICEGIIKTFNESDRFSLDRVKIIYNNYIEIFEIKF